MKKRTLKRLAVGLAVGMLFSTTLVYGNQIPYSFTLNPTQTAYSSNTAKMVEGRYATIRQTSPTSVIEYTIMTPNNITKAGPTKFEGAGGKQIRYTEELQIGFMLKLKAYNNPADNGGAIRNASGTWIP